jgi:hypothetical protein
MTSCNCNFDSQFAYILNNKNETPEKNITIVNYLENEELIKKVKNGKKFLVCSLGNELIKYKSNTKRSHFKHKSEFYNNEMSEWHKNWQNNFENTEITIGNRRADAVIGDIVLEFQHSLITKELVELRQKNYIENDTKLYWIIDCNNTIEYKELGKRYMIKFKSDFWKYENFVCHEFIFLNIDDKIFKIKPSKVKSRMIDVKEYLLKDVFINSIKNNEDIWKIDDITQCVLYHNQRGAGCGKTYESIQLIEKEVKFNHKDTFIYLTKMHSAKEVIYNEFVEQSKRGVLEKLIFDNDEDDDEIGFYNGSQYKITYINKETQKNCMVLIGTIDAFINSIGDKNITDKNRFSGMAKSIRDGCVNVSENGKIKFGGNEAKLNKDCLVIIDEAQDLGPEYIEAVCNIMRNTYMDTYVIGDKLQSIWGC